MEKLLLNDILTESCNVFQVSCIHCGPTWCCVCCLVAAGIARMIASRSLSPPPPPQLIIINVSPPSTVAAGFTELSTLD